MVCGAAARQWAQEATKALPVHLATPAPVGDSVELRSSLRACLCHAQGSQRRTQRPFNLLLLGSSMANGRMNCGYGRANCTGILNRPWAAWGWELERLLRQSLVGCAVDVHIGTLPITAATCPAARLGDPCTAQTSVARAQPQEAGERASRSR